MKKTFTLFKILFLCLLFLFSCQDNNFRNLEPKNGKNCLLIKEYTYKGSKRYLLNEYSYLDTSHVSKLMHYTPTGKQSESRFEYNQEGKLIRFYGCLTPPDAIKPYYGYLDYIYDDNGRLKEIKGYNTDNNNVVLAQQMLLFYNSEEQVNRIVSSYGSETLFTYDEKGNVMKVHYDSYVGISYNTEEYTSYNTKRKSNPLNDILFLRDIYVNPKGSNFSQNQATVYKTFNEDGSVKQAYSQKYYYDKFGKFFKFTSNAIGADSGTNNIIIEAEYKCK